MTRQTMHQRRVGGIQKQLFQPGNILRRYRMAAIGNQSLSSLIGYELVSILTNIFPEPLGRKARLLLYPFLFSQVGASPTFGRNMILRRPKDIKIGHHVTVGDSVALDVKGDGLGIFIADHVHIGAETIISCTGGFIRIGQESRIGRRCRLGSSMGLSVGRNCNIERESYLVGAAHAYDRNDIPIIEQSITCRGPNVVGDFVKIGKRVTVRDGVHIGDRCVVGDDTLVIRNIPDGTGVTGVPAKIISRPPC